MTEWIEVKNEEEEKEQTKMWEPVAVGESIQGNYIDKEEEVGQFKSNLYTLKTEKGEIKFWGSTVLDNLMEKVPMSSEVKIIFEGTKPSKSGKKPWKDYKVLYKKG
jgi:hypothetical protein